MRRNDQTWDHHRRNLTTQFASMHKFFPLHCEESDKSTSRVSLIHSQLDILLSSCLAYPFLTVTQHLRPAEPLTVVINVANDSQLKLLYVPLAMDALCSRARTVLKLINQVWDSVRGCRMPMGWGTQEWMPRGKTSFFISCWIAEYSRRQYSGSRTSSQNLECITEVRM